MAFDSGKNEAKPDWGLLCDHALWHRPQDAAIFGVEAESITDIDDPIPMAYRMSVQQQVWHVHQVGDGAELAGVNLRGAPAVIRQLLQDLEQSPQTITIEFLRGVSGRLRGAKVDDVACLRNCRLIACADPTPVAGESLLVVPSIRVWTSTRPPSPEQLEKMFPRVRDVK